MLSVTEEAKVSRDAASQALQVRQRTMVINALRGHCAEFGLIVAQGASKVEELVAMANKTARVAWALLRYERIYRPTPA